LGVPFDSFPANRFYFGSYFVPDEVNMGDLTGDGADEMALENDSISTLFLFSIVEVSAVIDDSLKRQNSEGLSCYPNPFNDATNIIINAAPRIKDKTEIGIYNITGKLIKNIQVQSVRGSTAVRWDGTDEVGNSVSSGIYFARLGKDQSRQSIKMIYLK
jgi:hypothetical protein